MERISSELLLGLAEFSAILIKQGSEVVQTFRPGWVSEAMRVRVGSLEVQERNLSRWLALSFHRWSEKSNHIRVA